MGHPIPARSRLLAAALAAGVCLAVVPAFVSAATDAGGAPASVTATPSAIAAKQVGDARDLIVVLRRAKTTTEQRQQAIDQLMTLGEEGAVRLAGFAGPEFVAKRDAYLNKFVQAANDVLQARAKENGGGAKVNAEIAALRKQSLETSRAPGLTKEAVKEKCDPAVKRLGELMTVSPEQALEAKPELKATRAEALAWAATYHAAAEKVTSADARKRLPPAPPTADEAEGAVAARERLVALLATPMSKQDQNTLLANESTTSAAGSKIDPEEAAAVLALNRLRVLLGIGAQQIDPKLCAAARGHSTDMAERKFFAHESPVAGKETPWKRAGLAGTSANAENIYMGSTKGADAIDAWWYSPGHHVNMMGTGKRSGVGRHDRHFTQMFGQ